MLQHGRWLPVHICACSFSVQQSLKMGADCCGGAATADPASIRAADAAQAQLADLHVTDAQPAANIENVKPAANGAAPAQPAKSDADIVKGKLPYFQRRIHLFEEYRKRDLQKIDAAKQANVPIKGAHDAAGHGSCAWHHACRGSNMHLLQHRCRQSSVVTDCGAVDYHSLCLYHQPLSSAVTLPDGGQKEGVAGATTPMDIAVSISKSLAKKVLISRRAEACGRHQAWADDSDAAQHGDVCRWRRSENSEIDFDCRVDGKTWDLTRPLEGECQLELLDFEHPIGKDVRFWNFHLQYPPVSPQVALCRDCRMLVNFIAATGLCLTADAHSTVFHAARRHPGRPAAACGARRWSPQLQQFGCHMTADCPFTRRAAPCAGARRWQWSFRVLQHACAC